MVVESYDSMAAYDVQLYTTFYFHVSHVREVRVLISVSTDDDMKTALYTYFLKYLCLREFTRWLQITANATFSTYN